MPPTTSGFASKTSWMRIQPARPRWTIEMENPSATIGHVMRPSACQNAKKSPFVIPPSSGPRRTSVPPYHVKMRIDVALTAPIIGPIDPRSRASPRLASRYALFATLKRESSCCSSAKLRTTRTPERFCWSTSLSLPIERWLSLFRAKSPREKLRVIAMRSGIVRNDAIDRRPEMRSMTWSALANANTTFTMLSTPKPNSSRTCARSFVARLMISPADIVR